MTITPTIVSYLYICHRKLWLHAHHLRMESTSELVAEGKLIGKTTYPQRALKWQELDLGIAKIDFFDPKSNTIHEIKKSNKKSFAHNAQVKYYLYLLHKIGILEPTAIIEYPKLRITETVEWDKEEDQDLVESWINQADTIIQGACPDKLPISKCKKCSYFDFCWSGE